MPLSTRLLLSAFSLSICGAVALAEDATPAPTPTPEVSKTVSASSSKSSAAAASPENAKLSVGTTLYDAATVGELFDEAKAENERREREQAEIVKSDDSDVIELAPLEVGPYDMYKYRQLAERIDPQPRQQLARLAELDPKAAAELRVSMRAEERFFAGEEDATYDANAGRVAEIDIRKASSAAVASLKKVAKKMKSKSMTDDQPDTTSSASGGSN